MSVCLCAMCAVEQVNDYPFTTRGVTVGHIVDKEAGTRYQVMDTPGKVPKAFLPSCCCPELVVYCIYRTGASFVLCK